MLELPHILPEQLQCILGPVLASVVYIRIFFTYTKFAHCVYSTLKVGYAEHTVFTNKSVNAIWEKKIFLFLEKKKKKKFTAWKTEPKNQSLTFLTKMLELSPAVFVVLCKNIRWPWSANHGNKTETTTTNPKKHNSINQTRRGRFPQATWIVADCCVFWFVVVFGISVPPQKHHLFLNLTRS